MTSTSSDARIEATSTTDAHVSHEAELNTATSHGAEGRGKSDRSSCAGAEKDVACVGASGGRRRATSATTSATTHTAPTTASLRITAPG